MVFGGKTFLLANLIEIFCAAKRKKKLTPKKTIAPALKVKRMFRKTTMFTVVHTSCTDKH